MSRSNEEQIEGKSLSLPEARCLNNKQAAAYLGIGVTLFMQIAPPPIKIGRRKVYDRLDLDALLEEYKHRGRAIKEDLWPENVDFTGAKTHRTGGSMSSCQVDSEYVAALGLETKTPPTSS